MQQATYDEPGYVGVFGSVSVRVERFISGQTY